MHRRSPSPLVTAASRGAALIALLVAACGDDAALPDAGTGLDAARDAAVVPTDLDDCLVGLEPPDHPEPFFRFVLLQDFVAGDVPGLTLRLALVPSEDYVPLGLTTPFVLDRFGVLRDGVVECVTDPAALAYDVTHHNFDDTAAATASSGRYAVHMAFDAVTRTWTDTLTVTHPESGLPAEGPMALTEAGCWGLPDGSSPCNERMPPP